MQKEKTKFGEKREEKKVVPVLGYLQHWLPIVISMVALLFSIPNDWMSLEQGKREKVFQPLHFEVSRGEQSLYYQISNPDGTGLRKIPGYEIDFSCKTGAYQEFAQIYYDGTTLEMAFADMDVLESGDYVIASKGQIPPSDYIQGEKIYDYCFVRTVAASGEKELWLIYYELDLLENTIKGPFKASDAILLLMQDEGTSAKADMLKNYQTLYEMVNALPGS